MARLVGLIGSGRGRLGTTVLSKGQNGLTYARTYQPQVANPRTELQVQQRAKINLVGQISKMVSKSLIKPLGMGGGRMNRSEFNKILLNAATVSDTAGGLVANVAPQAMKFSKGSVNLKASAGTATITASSLTIALTLYEASNVNKYGERIVAVVYPTTAAEEAGNAIEQVAFVDTILTQSTAQTVTLNFGSPLKAGNVVALYRIPFALNDESVAAKYGELYGTIEEIAAAVTENANTSLSWGNTEFVEAVNFTQA